MVVVAVDLKLESVCARAQRQEFVKRGVREEKN